MLTVLSYARSYAFHRKPREIELHRPSDFIADGSLTAIMCCVCPALAWIFSYVYYKQTASIILDPALRTSSDTAGLIQSGDPKEAEKTARTVWLVVHRAFLFSILIIQKKNK